MKRNKKNIDANAKSARTVGSRKEWPNFLSGRLESRFREEKEVS